MILMDCQMPEMDGYEATAQIRQYEASTDKDPTPIIAFTANAMRHDQEKCFDAGMDDFLPKPVSRDDLEEKLKKWLPGKLEKIGVEDFSPESDSGETEDVPPEMVDDKRQAVWNRGEALARLNGKEKAMARMVKLFIDDMPARVDLLKQAIDQGQVEEVASLAHAIKGVAGNISGSLLHQSAMAMEMAGKSADVDQIKTLWPQFFECYQQLYHCLQQE